MRVQGNMIPDTIRIEPYAREPGKVEVRLTENVQEVTKTDEITGQTYSMQEYDEYIFRFADTPGLREHIEANLTDYLRTGRELEYNAQASEVVDMRTAIDIALGGVSL